MAGSCVAMAKWGRSGHQTVKRAHPCSNPSTDNSRLCIHHELQLLRALVTSSIFQRSRIFREHFSDLTDADLIEVQLAHQVKSQDLTDTMNPRSNLDMIIATIRLNEPITISVLTEKVNEFMGYRYSKKQIGKALTVPIRDGIICKATTTRSADTAQLSEVVYSMPVNL